MVIFFLTMTPKIDSFGCESVLANSFHCCSSVLIDHQESHNVICKN